MTKIFLIIISLILILITGCNKKEISGQETNNLKKESKEMTPDVWAEEVNTIYERAILNLDAIIGNKPDLNDGLRTRVLDLKYGIIKELLEYGKMRGKMNQSDQKMCSSKLSFKLERIYKNPAWDRSINKVRMEYNKSDQAFGNQIMSFNIITQYAQFELLRKQEPDEAKRLGVE
jgi:hypothetical protein